MPYVSHVFLLHFGRFLLCGRGLFGPNAYLHWSLHVKLDEMRMKGGAVRCNADPCDCADGHFQRQRNTGTTDT